MFPMIWSFLVIYLFHSAHASHGSCETVGQLKAKEENCQHFYQCTPHGWTQLTCGHGLVFNQENSVCDWPKPGLKCGGNNDKNTGDNDKDQDDDSMLEICETVGQLKADVENCERFYQCTRIGWAPLHCQDSFYFNQKLSVCDLSETGTKCGQVDNKDDDNSKHESCDTVGELKAEEENCDRFYQCTPHGWTQLRCRHGLAFNPENSVCDWPKPGRKCEGGANTNTGDNDEDQDDDSMLEICETVGQLKADAENCERFYQCTRIGWAPLHCQDSFYFNQKLSVCDLSETGTKCGQVDNDDDDNSKHESCETLGELKAEEVNCDRFYQCTRYGWAQLTCGHGLVFNPENSVCDWPKPGLKCGGHTDPNTGDNDKDQDDDSMLEICETVGQLKADAENCERFYQCTRIGWAPLHCEDNFYFNQNTSVCDRSETGSKCGEADHDDDDDSKLEPCKTVGEFKLDAENCQNFYQCTNNGWKQLSCPNGLFFNSKINVCDWPKPGFKCGDDNDSDDDSDHHDDNHETGLEPCDEVGQVKVDTEHCDLYYQCSSCGWSLKSCEGDLLFNPKTSVCDKADRVTCAMEEDQPLDQCNNLGEMKSDPKNCNNYYQCTTYGWQNMSCSGALVFNPNISVCDYPENVKCEIKSD